MSGGAAISPKDEGLEWWRVQVAAGRYVGGRSGLPSGPAVRYLLAEQLLAETAQGWGWVLLSRENHDAGAALRLNYWPLVSVLLSSYESAAIERVGAVRLYVGEESFPPVLNVVQSDNASRRSVEVAPGLNAEVRPAKAPILPEHLNELRPAAQAAVRVLSPARTILSLTISDVRDHTDLVAAWLRSLILARPDLEAAYEAEPRHVLLARVGHMARDLGNRRLAEQIEAFLASRHRSAISRTRTQVGGAISVPTYLVAQPSLREPWADRFRARLARLAEVAREVTTGMELPRQDMAATLAQAREAKREDTYHSTTIEGYRITREDVQSVLEGRSYAGRTPEEIERLMALKGYSQAFERTLDLVAERHGSSGPVFREHDLSDLHVELWSPSVDAGIVNVADLRGWRRSPVYIRGSYHVPPGPDKVATLMRVLAEDVGAQAGDPAAQAIVAHWGFVHVHPFMDGNGRIARLLMNLCLCAGGLPWTVIRAQERNAYFAALERAHMEEDYRPFAGFVRSALRRAVAAGGTPED